MSQDQTGDAGVDVQGGQQRPAGMAGPMDGDGTYPGLGGPCFEARWKLRGSRGIFTLRYTADVDRDQWRAFAPLRLSCGTRCAGVPTSPLASRSIRSRQVCSGEHPNKRHAFRWRASVSCSPTSIFNATLGNTSAARSALDLLITVSAAAIMKVSNPGLAFSWARRTAWDPSRPPPL